MNILALGTQTLYSLAIQCNGHENERSCIRVCVCLASPFQISQLTVAPLVKSNHCVLHLSAEVTLYGSQGTRDAYNGMGAIAPDFIVDLHTIYKCPGPLSGLTTCFWLPERCSCSVDIASVIIGMTL